MFYSFPTFYYEKFPAYVIVIAITYITRASLVAQSVKNLPVMQETLVQSLGLKDPLEEEMATHSSILTWESPWREDPGRVFYSLWGCKRVRHDWAHTNHPSSSLLNPLSHGVYALAYQVDLLTGLVLIRPIWSRKRTPVTVKQISSMWSCSWC